MANIYEFEGLGSSAHRRKRARKLLDGANSYGHAEIIIFPGVRYEREKPSSPKRGRAKKSTAKLK